MKGRDQPACSTAYWLPSAIGLCKGCEGRRDIVEVPWNDGTHVYKVLRCTGPRASLARRAGRRVENWWLDAKRSLKRAHSTDAGSW